jgi:hypothetical protein
VKNAYVTLPLSMLVLAAMAQAKSPAESTPGANGV